jgi:hypothetical protein
MALRSKAVVRWGWSADNAPDGQDRTPDCRWESPPPRAASSLFATYEKRAALSSPLKGEEAKAPKDPSIRTINTCVF